ncbi:hypothetical protein RI367_000558 [Sorochytrium milnesiophthora]
MDSSAQTFDVHRPFTPTQRLYILFGIVPTAIGVLLNGCLAAVLIVKRERLLGSLNMFLILHLNLADLLYHMSILAMQILKFTANDYSLLGPQGCNTEGSLIALGITGSTAAVLWVALERYDVIVRERPRRTQTWIALLVLGWVFPLAMATAPLVSAATGSSAYRFVLQPAGFFCYHDWQIQDAGWTAYVRLVSLITYAALAAMAFMYSRIYFKVRRIHRSASKILVPAGAGAGAGAGAATTQLSTAMATTRVVASAVANSVTGEVGVEKHQVAHSQRPAVSMEHTVLVKCLLLTSSFALSWVVYLVSITALTYGRQVPPWYDVVSAILALVCPIFNWACIVFLDVVVRRAMRGMVQSVVAKCKGFVAR